MSFYKLKNLSYLCISSIRDQLYIILSNNYENRVKKCIIILNVKINSYQDYSTFSISKMNKY